MAATSPPLKEPPSLDHERILAAAGMTAVAGIDEAGRGALAGPVVAAAVILPGHDSTIRGQLSQVRDSKLLSTRQRAAAIGPIKHAARAWAVGMADHAEIDDHGLIAATRMAMARALASLPIRPDFLLLDYTLLPEDGRPQIAFVRGERQSLSIAAASIIAKVTRDQIMIDLDHQFPGYGLAKHKGYGTAVHRQALVERGPSPIHRRSYAPVAEVLDREP